MVEPITPDEKPPGMLAGCKETDITQVAIRIRMTLNLMMKTSIKNRWML
jgi:hypothetical protein